MSTTDKKETVKKQEETVIEQEKTATKEYSVLKKFTGEKVHYPSQTVTLEPDTDQTRYLLTNKFIK